MTIEVIFFTRSVGLSNHEVAVGLAVAAAVGLLSSIPAGHWADRRGPRELAVLLLLLEGVSMAAFVLVHSFTAFIVVAIAGAVSSSAGGGIRMAIIARLGVGEKRVRVRAYLRAVTNFGISIGMVFAGEVRIAARAYRRSGFLVGAACVFYAAAQGAPVVLACAVLVVGMLLHTLGELFSSAASWGISFDMAPEDQQGQYQGAYSMGRGVSGVLGPLVVIGTAITLGRLGWVLLAGMFVAIGLLYPPLVRRHLLARSLSNDE